ncbi:hypothetical protein [Burkholderia territorii]|uniref:hypothetical protein n=1 Tax=Burkholderia territorii TaxID=1503055 RepID=UPI000754046C|nr:hypothetical protein [Burkholderia territorii]KWE31569.1 hypothetical protein WT49_21615 [Burkholderia territorii]KWE32165.1 hypothetical protein WT50_04755 [Burkholderia territorii]KWE53465.1 hypothetical protein WT51_06060 [Burkholderia territorii]
MKRFELERGTSMAARAMVASVLLASSVFFTSGHAEPIVTGPLSVDGSLVVLGPVTVDGSLTVAGNISARGPITAASIERIPPDNRAIRRRPGENTFHGPLTVHGPLIVHGDLEARGPITVGGDVGTVGTVGAEGPITERR